MPERHTDRERWEVMIATILRRFRPALFIGGCILLIYALASVFAYLAVAVISMALALFLFLMVFSDKVTLLIARLGAWLATVGRSRL